MLFQRKMLNNSLREMHSFLVNVVVSMVDEDFLMTTTL